MQRMLLLVVNKRVCQMWLPVGGMWRVGCQDGQPIKLVAQMYRAMCEISSRVISLPKQVVSIAIERGITCG